MVPAPLILLFLLMGLGLGISLGIAIDEDKAHNSQFKKDCVAMVHGKVDGNICERNGKILFHK